MAGCEVAGGMTRRDEVCAALNRVLDPCSVGAGVPIGLVDMGLIESLDISGNEVEVAISPTSTSCILVAVFASQAEVEIGGIPWVEKVVVSIVAGERPWTEDRMSPVALRRLEDVRHQRRRISIPSA